MDGEKRPRGRARGKSAEDMCHKFCRLTDADIMGAARKPPLCSDARWRIELRRRRNERRYKYAEDPDLL